MAAQPDKDDETNDTTTAIATEFFIANIPLWIKLFVPNDTGR